LLMTIQWCCLLFSTHLPVIGKVDFGQFHQHFKCAFVPIFLPLKKISNLICKYKKALCKIFV
jgi:hypothetical protein